jgi:single-strand DNA-binding protein
MLRVTLLGNLGADPEVRYTQKGTQMVSFNVAVNQVRFGRDGERQENTEWFRIRVTGRQSEFAQRLSKGTKVLVIGRLDITHFQGKDGESRTGFDVWADDVQTMSAGRALSVEADGAEAEQEAMEPALAGRAAPSNGRARSSGRAGPPAGDAAELEDLPF